MSHSSIIDIDVVGEEAAGGRAGEGEGESEEEEAVGDGERAGEGEVGEGLLKELVGGELIGRNKERHISLIRNRCWCRTRKPLTQTFSNLFQSC